MSILGQNFSNCRCLGSLFTLPLFCTVIWAPTPIIYKTEPWCKKWPRTTSCAISTDGHKLKGTLFQLLLPYLVICVEIEVLMCEATSPFGWLITAGCWWNTTEQTTIHHTMCVLQWWHGMVVQWHGRNDYATLVYGHTKNSVHYTGKDCNAQRIEGEHWTVCHHRSSPWRQTWTCERTHSSYIMRLY